MLFKRIFKPIIATSALSVLLASCTGFAHRTREDYASIDRRNASYAISQEEKTSLGDALKTNVESNSGKSGFYILQTGEKSLKARFGLILAAEKTLDLQYYAISDDVTSNLLIETIIRAAKRGVRVRFLIDDISITDIQRSLSALDGLENVEIRIFNPVTTQSQSTLARLAVAITHADQVTKRMHNKALIADNQLAIIGGRNLGDEYFDANPDMSFKDIDVLTAGPATADISKSFDDFWNDKNAFPISELYPPDKDGKHFKKLEEKLQKNWDDHMKTPEGKRSMEFSAVEILNNPDYPMTWAPATVFADKPEKISEPQTAQPSKPINLLAQKAERAEKEFILISPYFVPRDEGTDWLISLKEKGIRVRVLTNSLASTDVVAVHSGYQDYRERLVRNGIEIYEMKPVEGQRPKQRPLGRKAPAYASLHAKAYVIDGKETIIGSFNFDPRSYNLNTEIGIAIESDAISKKISDMFDKTAQPQNSYRILPDGDRGIYWLGSDKGKEIRHHSEPDASIWRKIQNALISLLPVEEQL